MQRDATAQAAQQPGVKRKLLLVDDDAPLRKNLVRAFERENFEVATAGSLKEAYEVAGEFAPDFAVVDLNLQDGYGNIATAVAAVKAGAVDYLAKPADADEVINALLATGAGLPPPPENPMSADRVRWEHIQRVFEQCNRNVSETARRLNMHRRTLQRILNKRAPRE